MTAAARLVALILELFTLDELRRFVAAHLADLAANLRDDVSPRAYAEALIDLLGRRGELDASFFAGLAAERPRLADRIGAVAALYGRAGRAPTPYDPEIAAVEARVAALQAAGLDVAGERSELLKLRRRQRSFPAPVRGARIAGRWLLDAELGQGGFASVWRAFDGETHRQVALKILHSHHATDPVLRARFARGMRTMQSHPHDHILAVHAPEVHTDGLVFAVLELISGGDLQQAILRRRIAPEQSWGILLAVCDALAGLHDRGLVHRDLKPSNILLTDSGSPRLTDFDLVLDRDTTGGTRTGALGSVLYSAPELWNDARDAIPAADVYSLAMTAVYTQLGTPLTPDVLRDTAAVLADLDIGEPLRAVLRRALAWQATDRYPDARALGEALAAALRRLAAAVEVDPDPLAGHDILYWIADERGQAETVWLHEVEGRATVVARAPGIALAAGTRVWRLHREVRQIRGCKATEDSEQFQVVALDVDAAELVEVDGDERVPLGLFTALSDPEIPVGAELPWPESSGPIEFAHTVSPTFSAGSYLLVRSTQALYYDTAAHGEFIADFAVVDLRTGGSCELLTAEEREHMIRELGPVANIQFRREHGEERPESSQDDLLPALTAVLARYDGTARLALTYQFTEETYYAASDYQWSDYTWSTRVPAPRLPAALVPLQSAPRLLQMYWRTAPQHTGSHGWTAAPRTPEVRLRLRRCFDALARAAPL